MPGERPLNVLIAGGGVAAFETALALRALAGERVSCALLTPGERFVYRPGIVPALFGHGVVERFDLDELAAAAGAVVVHDAVEAVDPEHRLVFTAVGVPLPYDALVVAVGARADPAVPGARTLLDDGGEVRSVVVDLEARRLRRIVVAVPAGTTWPLPAYEAALQLADLARRRRAPVEVTLVTPEEQPLGVFGQAAVDEVRALLALHSVGLVTGASPVAFVNDVLALAPSRAIGADEVIALPRLRGPGLPGLASDHAGFLRTDAFGRVGDLPDVFAAGDATAFPVKQGGLATQQADVVAAAIAADAGADVAVKPFEPVLRGMLLSAREPRFLRTELTGGHGDTSSVSTGAMWWPASKIPGRYLGPFLAERLAGAGRPVG